MQFGHVKTHLGRTPWGDFPDVVIHADESLVKRHPLYAAAKQGDPDAAEGLVLDASTLGALDRITAIVGDSKPKLLAVHALETEGMNSIPRVLARILAKLLDLPVASGIIQINRVSHTGADGYHRLAFPALFGGLVEPGDYFLVDDFVGQGGTLANLKGFVESRGGRVVGADRQVVLGEAQARGRDVAGTAEEAWNGARRLVGFCLRLWL